MENEYEIHKEIITHMLSNLTKENEETKILECFEILIKLFQQIGKIPNEKKYRTFNKNNPKIKNSVLNIKGIEEVLSAMGYRSLDDYTLIFDSNKIDIIFTAIEILEFLVKLINIEIENKRILSGPDCDVKRNLLMQIEFQEKRRKEKEIQVLRNEESKRERESIKWIAKDSNASQVFGYGKDYLDEDKSDNSKISNDNKAISDSN